MEFETSPDISHLFVDALAAFMRHKADTVWLAEHGDWWNELYGAFTDTEAVSVKISYEAGALMHHVWGTPWVWRDEQTRQYVKGHLRPQWRKQVYARANSR